MLFLRILFGLYGCENLIYMSLYYHITTNKKYPTHVMYRKSCVLCPLCSLLLCPLTNLDLQDSKVISYLIILHNTPDSKKNGLTENVINEEQDNYSLRMLNISNHPCSSQKYYNKKMLQANNIASDCS